MGSTTTLIKLPDDLVEPSAKIVNALKSSKEEHGLHGLNISHLANETGLSKYLLNKVLGSLETAGIVKYEQQGTSKVYYLNEGK